MNAMDAIVDRVLDALRADPPVTTGPIDEDVDTEQLAESVNEAVSVSLVNSDPQATAQILGHPVDWVSTVVVETFARRDERTSGGRASRALQALVYARLMADPRLGGVVDDIRDPTITTENDWRSTRMGRCVASYPMPHRTAARTLDV